jgi:hypothetical protein
LPSCDACQNGIGEPWEKFVESLEDASPKFLRKAWITWWKRTSDYHLAECRTHTEEASDRRDYIQVLKEGLFLRGTMTPTEWIEGRRRLREEKGARFYFPPELYDTEKCVLCGRTFPESMLILHTGVRGYDKSGKYCVECFPTLSES